MDVLSGRHRPSIGTTVLGSLVMVGGLLGMVAAVDQFVTGHGVAVAVSVVSAVVFALVLVGVRRARPSAARTVLTVVSTMFMLGSIGIAVTALSGAKVTAPLSLTDRHSGAIGLLGREDTPGHSELTSRLGGVYALERLMHDSPADEPTIIEELCAFVRTHAPAVAGSAGVPPRSVPTSPPDVQAAITVLGRRPAPDADRNQPLDLSNTRLSIPKAQLTDAHLSGAYLAGANLIDAHLAGAYLNGANLINADLTADALKAAHLNTAMLKAAHLNVADLTGAELTHADLTNAYLRGANLSGANLSGANLSGANLSGVDLSGVDLDRADLTGADLSTSRALSSAQVRCARVDASTRLPIGVARPIKDAPEQDSDCRLK